MTCGAGDDTVKLDAQDTIADATEENPDGSCEDVQQSGEQTDGESGDRQRRSGRGEDCPGKEEKTASGESQS